MMPRNGDSGSSIPPGSSATLRARSVLMMRGVGLSTSVGSTPEPGPVLLTPYGTRNSRSTTRTSSMSPGAAPSIQIGPVSTCTPRPLGCGTLA